MSVNADNDGKPAKPGSLRPDYVAPPAAGQPVTVTPSKQKPSSTSPGVLLYTAAPNQAANEPGWYSSPRPVKLPNTVAQTEMKPGVQSQALTSEDKKWLDGLAEHLGQNRTGDSIWRYGVDTARTTGQSAWGIIMALAKDNGYGTDGKKDPKGKDGPKGSGPSGSGYTGPSTSTTRQYADRASLTDLADQISMEMVGRGVTKAEMDRIEKRVKVYEKNHPDVSVSQSGVGASSSSSYDGASAAGRQDVIERIVSKNPAYGDYQKATTMMDWFDQALNERLQANG